MKQFLLTCGCMIAFTGAALAQETTTYTYDVHGRLIEVNRSTPGDTDYTYDDGNSRTAKVTTGALLMSQPAAGPAVEEAPEPEAEPEPPEPETSQPS